MKLLAKIYLKCSQTIELTHGINNDDVCLARAFTSRHRPSTLFNTSNWPVDVVSFVKWSGMEMLNQQVIETNSGEKTEKSTNPIRRNITIFSLCVCQIEKPFIFRLIKCTTKYIVDPLNYLVMLIVRGARPATNNDSITTNQMIWQAAKIQPNNKNIQFSYLSFALCIHSLAGSIDKRISTSNAIFGWCLYDLPRNAWFLLAFYTHPNA